MKFFELTNRVIAKGQKVTVKGQNVGINLNAPGATIIIDGELEFESTVSVKIVAERLTITPNGKLTFHNGQLDIEHLMNMGKLRINSSTGRVNNFLDANKTGVLNWKLFKHQIGLIRKNDPDCKENVSTVVKESEQEISSIRAKLG